jgi:hypothetical protein
MPWGPVSAPVTWAELPDVEMADFTIATMPARFAELGDLHAGIDDAVWSIEPLLEWADRDEHDRGLGDMPYPPNYPKQEGEPPRVQPSRMNKANWDEAGHHVGDVEPQDPADATRSPNTAPGHRTAIAALRAANSLAFLPSDPAAAVEEMRRRREEIGSSYFIFGSDVADIGPIIMTLRTVPWRGVGRQVERSPSSCWVISSRRSLRMR